MFSIGQTIKLGSYQQKSDFSEEIEWIVIEEKNDKVLLLSKYALDKKEYSTEDLYEVSKEISWENCTVRSWLNDVFFTNVFDEQQQALIMETELQPPENRKTLISSCLYVYPRNPTNDKLFLLSLEEAASISQEFLRCIPSDYVVTLETEDRYHQFGNHRDYCPWLLRSPGEDKSMVAYVSKEGNIDYDGCDLTNPYYDYIRPAMWVSVPSLIEYQQKLTTINCFKHRQELEYRYRTDKCEYFLKYESTVTPTRKYKECYGVSKGDFEGVYVIVPNREFRPITEISAHAFENYKKLEKIEMPNTIDTIGAYAFQNCESLKEIVFPESLLFIEEEAFSNCNNLTHITIPSSLISIGPNAFKNCIHLNTIKYLGDKKEWKQIRININGNKCLKKATKVFLKK